LAVLAILQADARVAARLSGALSADHRVVVRPDWEALRRALDKDAFDGCLVDAEHPDRDEATREIGHLRNRYPGLAIVACVDVRHSQGYFDLGEMGVDGILPSASLANARVRSIIDDALATARATRIARALKGRFPAPAPDAIEWAVENAGSDTSVEKLASALGHTPRSLRQALEAAGFPGPTRVLLWGRLLLAGARLSRDGRTVEEVAFSLGYSTATSLARAMKRQTGLTPREVSEHGGMDRVRDVLFSDQDRTGSSRGLGKIASLVLGALLTSACATFGGGGPSVDRQAIDAILDAPPMDRAHFGVLAVDAATGRTLYARNPHQWFVPASNQKILVTAAAWSLLGPDYRFRTEVWATGPFDISHLDGDLVVVGSGDPSLSSRYWETDTAAIEALADSLRAKGPGHVTGSLIVDVSAWDSTTLAPTREVGDLPGVAASTGGAFAIAEGEVEVVLQSGASVGAPAVIAWSPVGTPDYVQSLVTTAEPDSGTRVAARHLPETRQLILEGHVALGVTDTLFFSQRDPVRQAVAALARAVDAGGVMTEAEPVVRWTAGETVGIGCAAGTVRECPGVRLVTALESPPLSELVAGVLAPSQNWIAEQLTLTLGAEHGEHGSWEEGVSVIERFLIEEVGVDTLDVSARDGSGLSAYNLVTPRALARVLQFMDARDDSGAYRAAMAEPGEVDSTLEERLSGLEGRVFAKTGSISNVNSLSGYLVRKDGERVVFSILSNSSGLPANDMRDAIDAVVRVLAR
jgi:D-alanyl-D-alanine carboxypeptidase/D-alanyl-D-alanine-endopeptidase (penicillin-binding protein 4)